MYEVEGLKDGIERAKINIKIFRDAMNKEIETISEYEQMIKFSEAEEGKIGNINRPDSKP